MQRFHPFSHVEDHIVHIAERSFWLQLPGLLISRLFVSVPLSVAFSLQSNVSRVKIELISLELMSCFSPHQSTTVVFTRVQMKSKGETPHCFPTMSPVDQGVKATLDPLRSQLVWIHGVQDVSSPAVVAVCII